MKSIQVGLTLPQGWLDEFPTKNPHEHFLFSKDVALKAEKLGYHAGYVYDHFVPHPGDNRRGPFLEAYTLLSSIASITSKIRIGQIVTCNSYRHPFGTPDILEEKINLLKAKCKVIQRSPAEIENSVLLRVLVGKDNDDVKEIVSKLKKKNESVAEFILRSKDSIALGTPEEVTDYLDQYVQIGIRYLIVNFIGLSKSLEMLSLFSRKVIPRLR
ncbi:MAG: LLM class flavin-dependent oxidoreductase [Nitrosotalea sp.]